MLLTLDLSGSIGWTCGIPADQQFASGTQVIRSSPEDIGGFLQAFDDWLSEALADVTLCVFESPIFLSKSTITTLRKLYGQAAHLEWRCRQSRIECAEANNMKIKSFLGVAGFRGREGKAAMIRAVQRFGYTPATDDEADAIALRLYAIHQRFPELQEPFNLRLGLLGAV